MAARTKGLEYSPSASMPSGRPSRPNHWRDEPLSPTRIGRLVRLHLREQTPKQICRRIAETSGVDLSTETARNWKREDRGVSDVVNFLLLCRAYPALAAEANRLIAMEADPANDREFQRAFQAFLVAWQTMRPK